MRNSIQRILVETLEMIMDHHETHGLQELHEMTRAYKSISDKMVRRILSLFIENADKALCEDAKAQRKADGFTIKERGIDRSTHTFLGNLEYERTYFKKEGGGYAYILDHILGVGAYERVDAGVSADMVNLASMYSFDASAGIATSGEISRQTAWKRMQDVGEVAYLPHRSDATPEVLHIFADEDHVNLQDGKNTQIPLITYCAGKKTVCKGRNELIAPVHIQGYGLSPQRHWEYVYGLISEQYDMRKVRKLFIYGDGAAWIKSGLDVFPDAVFAFDEYHLEKRIRSLLSGEECKGYTTWIREAINSGDRALFQKLFYRIEDTVMNAIKAGKCRRSRLKSIQNDGAFLLAHWQEILNLRDPLSIGSCTEALVSHVLSKRFSRDPMGWSKHGLSKLAMVRVFCLNGGIVMPCDIGAGKADERIVIDSIKSYEEIIMRQQDEVFKEWRDWRWFSKDDDNLISRKTTGTKVALDALVKMRDI